MRTLLLVGGVAAGILYYVYEWYCNRENQHMQRPYGSGSEAPLAGDEDYIVINETTPKKTLSSRELPGKDDDCGICLDPLIRRDGDARGYAIIALPKCHHWFHQKCAIRLLEYHPSCPVCREPIDNAALRGTAVRFMAPLSDRNENQASSSTRTKKSD